MGISLERASWRNQASPWTVAALRQLYMSASSPEGSSVLVLEQQPLLLPRPFYSLKHPALNHIKVISFLALPAPRCCVSVEGSGPMISLMGQVAFKV